jgi:hypothetical protein
MISIVHHDRQLAFPLWVKAAAAINPPESQEWETIRLRGTVQVYSHERRN